MVGAIIPPLAIGTGRGSREYQFFRAAIKWLEGKGKLPKGTFSKYLQEAKRAANEDNGMMNWKNVFDDLSGSTPQDMHRSALKKVTDDMWEYSTSYEEDERKVFQRLSQSARQIADRRAENTGHGEITRDWEDVASKLERQAGEGAKMYGDTIEPVEVPEPAAVESGVGFAEAEEAAAVGAEVAEGIGAEEILSILAVIFLL